MLILTRQEGEEIVIVVDGAVVATVRLAELRGDKARIGIDAAPAVGIHRAEVWERIKAEKAGDSGGKTGGGGVENPSGCRLYDPDAPIATDTTGVGRQKPTGFVPGYPRGLPPDINARAKQRSARPE